ncbi:hypothetical protein PVAND_012957 [Polypedilum vanderplanki]|uniref:Chemosensory protein n=1 Tax=Polypedilum vanderplanki TaxID=319348 RepID=A0A9J6CQ01_POLVA|nr:hypothetical protein PVAND_012957 [Polypedilum vanderplanki]
MSWRILYLFLIISLVPAFSLAQGASEDDKNFYSRRYDSIDVDLIFRSSRLLNNYVDCLLDKKPCPPEGKDLKRVLPHALRTKCARCTKIQKTKALDVITRLYYEHPSIYLALAERYDPTGEYTKNFENWFDEQNGVKPRPPIPNFQNDPVSDNQSEGQQFNRRSPVIDESTTIATTVQRSRIPSSWITTPTTTTQRTTTTRAPLRTLTPTVRNDKPTMTTVSATTQNSQTTAPPNFLLLLPRPGGPITQSINKILDTTDKLVNNFGQMFRQTLDILAG